MQRFNSASVRIHGHCYILAYAYLSIQNPRKVWKLGGGQSVIQGLLIEQIFPLIGRNNSPLVPPALQSDALTVTILCKENRRGCDSKLWNCSDWKVFALFSYIPFPGRFHFSTLVNFVNFLVSFFKKHGALDASKLYFNTYYELLKMKL